MKLELKRIGNSTGLILPKELLARLGLKQGDEVFVTEGPEKSVTVSAYDPEHAKVLENGLAVFKADRETFKALAK